MLLAIDAGNTHIVLGCLEGDSLRFTARLRTDRAKTRDEYALLFRSLFDLHHVEPSAVEGAVLSCVVSELTNVLCRAVEAVTEKKPLVVGAGIKTGLNIKIDDPGQLGADLVVGAVAATDKYPKPMIVFDMGTANTMSVIDKEGRFLGGAILAGLQLSVDALSSGTSQLPSHPALRPQKGGLLQHGGVHAVGRGLWPRRHAGRPHRPGRGGVGHAHGLGGGHRRPFHPGGPPVQAEDLH